MTWVLITWNTSTLPLVLWYWIFIPWPYTWCEQQKQYRVQMETGGRYWVVCLTQIRGRQGWKKASCQIKSNTNHHSAPKQTQWHTCDERLNTVHVTQNKHHHLWSLKRKESSKSRRESERKKDLTAVRLSIQINNCRGQRLTITHSLHGETSKAEINWSSDNLKSSSTVSKAAELIK